MNTHEFPDYDHVGEDWWLDNDPYRVYTFCGKLHRLYAPARKTSKFEQWCLFGHHHRLDGHAYIQAGRTREYWIHGYHFVEQNHNDFVVKHYSSLIHYDLFNPIEKIIFADDKINTEYQLRFG